MMLREFLYWIYLMARAANRVLGPIFEPPDEGKGILDDDEDMKPERIQIWRLILEFVLAVDEAAKETGKSRGSDPDPAGKVAE